MGPEAQKLVGVRNKRKKIRPDLSNTKWKYVFIQSNSRIRKLPEGSYFLFCKFVLAIATVGIFIVLNNYFVDGQVEEADEKLSPSRKSTPSPMSAAESDTLKIVGQEYYKLYPVEKECKIAKFVGTIKVAYKSGLGYGFYQFTKPELISYDKQVILMGTVCILVISSVANEDCAYFIIDFQNNKLYYGPDARQIIGIPHQGYDESKEIVPPNFEHTTWKCAFIQTRSNVRVLQANTHFLYCKYHWSIYAL
jgi:hypothetical protein